MREILREYGTTLIAGTSTVMVLMLFLALVLSKDGPVALHMMAYAKSYAGETEGFDEAADIIVSDRTGRPSACIAIAPRANEVYGMDELFEVSEGGTIRVLRVSLLDTEILKLDNERGWYDMTEDVVSDHGHSLFFPVAGDYELLCKRTDERGASVTSSYMISVGE